MQDVIDLLILKMNRKLDGRIVIGQTSADGIGGVGGYHVFFEADQRGRGGSKDKGGETRRTEGTGNGGRIPNKITSTPELEEHLKYREYVDENGKKHKNKKGIVGAHNSDEFFKNDVLIRSENKVYDINGNEVKGVRQIEYSMPEIDGKTEKPTGNYNQSTNTKTIYDPNIISDREYVDRGIEAVNNALEKEPSGVLPHTWTGVDSKGVTWLGYYKNGKVTSFFPTSP
ncbi:hypothetical protein M2298_003123 [Brevibacillus sp. 1238]|nr:hypothetical protein [Brevibacillus sp. 1238]